MFENIEDITSIREKFATILDLVKLIYINIFVSHICACAWHYVGVIEVGLKYPLNTIAKLLLFR
jgi:potassium voltage-gated channel Eag-related subfamily H protein 5